MIFNKCINELNYMIRSKVISSYELVKIFLNRIKKDKLNIFININEKYILKRAKIVDKIIHNNKNITKFTGIPIAHKDSIITKNFLTTASSKILKSFLSNYDSNVVKLLNNAGAITIGKLNCDEFSIGSDNTSSIFGECKNPWDKNTTTGGSSGGSAASVAARLVPCATATDTGGSLRLPAALCGVTGIKPTYGIISRYGMIPFASSLDQIGIIAKTAEDCAIVLEQLCNKNNRDSASEKYKFSFLSFKNNREIRDIKIGIVNNLFDLVIDEEIKNSNFKVINFFKKNNISLIDINLKNIELYIPIYYAISSVELLSNLSCYDGIRYGYKNLNLKDKNDYIKYRNKFFGNNVKKRFLYAGISLLQENNKENIYIKALKIRKIISDELLNILQGPNRICDCLICPITPFTSWKKSDMQNNYLKNKIDIFTVLSNLVGLPSLSIPCGFNKENHPIGIQLIGGKFTEELILKLAYIYQKNNNWHIQYPKL